MINIFIDELIIAIDKKGAETLKESLISKNKKLD